MTKTPPNSTLSHVLKHHLILPLHPFFHSDSIALTAILDADGILATPDITDRFGFAISDPIKFSDPKNNNNQGGDIKKKQRVVPLRNEAKISINLKSDGTTVLHTLLLTYSHRILPYILSITPFIHSVSHVLSIEYSHTHALQHSSCTSHVSITLTFQEKNTLRTMSRYYNGWIIFFLV